MWGYLKSHERFILEFLDGKHNEYSIEDMIIYHEKQIKRMQHERVIHLMVTLTFAILLVLTIFFTTIHPTICGLLLLPLLLILTSAYIIHYFRLENSVQRWYYYSNRLEGSLNRPVIKYDPLKK